MSRLVVINLGAGDLQHGCPSITARISQSGESRPPMQFLGSLPPAPEIDRLYERWQTLYEAFYRMRSLRNTRDFEIVSSGVVTLFSEGEFRVLCQQLQTQINTWLTSETFLNIDQQVRSQLSPNEEIRFIIETDNDQLRRLPWHRWRFFRDYRKAELALSRREYKQRDAIHPQIFRKQIRILAILGNSEGIDLDAEIEFLKNLPDTEIKFLVKPDRREFNTQLWDEVGWDILFFAGHSQTEGATGRIYINENRTHNSLTIEELEEALVTAIDRGLQLAIFNSCEGLGLANALAKLDISQVIVMREPVPNLVAQEFFRYFLAAFADQRLPLYLAVQEARRKLQGLEDHYPAASWLPVICQNPTLEPLSWLQLGGGAPCPYRSLEAFREEDAPFFYGRESVAEQLGLAVNRQPLVAVIGASGSGKSSVVFAGLIPRLRASWGVQIITFRPGPNPYEALATALAPYWYPGVSYRRSVQLDLVSQLHQDAYGLCDIIVSIRQQSASQRFVLVIDQFEEIFTGCSPTDRESFLDSLLTAIANAPGFTLVFTLRADFLGQALAYAPLGQALQDYPPTLMLAMNREELERAILRPAADMHVRFEEGLVKRLIDEVEDQPGRLPLLEFALTQLWSTQQDGWLSHQSYEQIGGVKEALANHAEAIYAQFSEADRQRAQQVFVQLVNPGVGAEDTRRLATRAEIREENWDLVNRLADARLVVTSRSESQSADTVEIVHETLIHSWGRFVQWIEDDGEFRRWQEQLRAALRQWEHSGGGHDDLLRGKPLIDAEEWREKRLAELSDAEQAFIQSSVDQRDRQIRLKNRRRRWTLSGLAAGLVAALGLAGAAWLQSQQVRVSEAKAIAASAEALLASNNKLDALIAALRAHQSLKSLGGWVDEATRIQGEWILRRAIYQADEVNRLGGHTAGINAVVFSRDGDFLATASDDHTVKLWKSDGTLLSTLSGHIDEIWGVAISPGGELIATASDDRTVKLWTPDGALLRTLEGHTDEVAEVSFSSDGQLLASSSDDMTARIWTRDGVLLHILEGHTDEVERVLFSPDGQIVATGSQDKTIKLWTRDGEELITLSGHDHYIEGLAFSPDSQTLASASRDQTVKLWTLDGEEQLTLTGHTAPVFSVAFSPDGQRIATASVDQTVKLWTRDGVLLKTLRGHSDSVHCVTFSPDGELLLSASDDRTVKFWKPDSPLLTTLKSHNNDIWSVAISPDGDLIASTSDDRSVKLWTRDGALLKTLKGHGSRVNSVAFSPDGELIASASDDKTVKLWTRDGGLINTLASHGSRVNGVTISPDGELIASVSDDDTIKLWTREGDLLKTLVGHRDTVNSVAFSPTGELLASASDDDTLKLWTRAGDLVMTLEGHQDEVEGVAFSPNGDILASASDDGFVKLWTLDGSLFKTLEGNRAGLTAGLNNVTFSADGDLIAAASEDKTIKLWTADGDFMVNLAGHNREVSAVAFSPDNQRIASASRDETVILWNLDRVTDLDDLLAYGCDWVQDYLKTHPDVDEPSALCPNIL
ncbi:MAG: CHAT domain-containing protein [Leptolyngbyaceae cyanobacterium MO_188.B28]|nr:CHAT domain-containing protein [Leptolyngbyaceae cyanobacterium MO_188.B28]